MEVLNQVIPVYLVSLTFFNVYVHPVVRPPFRGGYFYSCNIIYGYNRMGQSDLVIEKYWVTQGGYFRILATVSLGMGILDWKLVYSHVVS